MWEEEWTHDGLLVASRASLSRRLLCPAEDSLRCLSALWTLPVTLCPPVALPERLPDPVWFPLVVCGMGIGVALSAAIDRLSRLATGFSVCGSAVTHCTHTKRRCTHIPPPKSCSWRFKSRGSARCGIESVRRAGEGHAKLMKDRWRRIIRVDQCSLLAFGARSAARHGCRRLLSSS